MPIPSCNLFWSRNAEINKLRIEKNKVNIHLILEEKSPEQSRLCVSAYPCPGVSCCLKIDKFSWVELVRFTKYIIIKKC